MKYMGSKAKHAKELVPIINSYRTSDDQIYIEPFVGGCNMMEHITGKRVGVDKNNYLIRMWFQLQYGWIPEDYYSEQDYHKAKEDFTNRTNKYYKDYEIGFIGFASSYGGRFFEGYARGNDNNGNPRNYTLESKKNIMKQVPKIKDVVFICKDYKDTTPRTSGNIFYCDSPYQGTKDYKTSLLGKFDHEHYHNWLRMVGQNNTVLVSEYNMPDDFECIWSKKVNSSLTQDTGAKQGVEKLFIYRK